MQYLLAINFMDNLINFFEYIFFKKIFHAVWFISGLIDRM